MKYFLTIYPKILKVLKNQGDPWNSKFFCRGVGGGQADSKTLLRLLFNKNITFLDTYLYDIILILQPVRDKHKLIKLITYNNHTYSTIYLQHLLILYICRRNYRTFYKNPKGKSLRKNFLPPIFFMFLWVLGPSGTPHKNFLPPLFYSSCDIYLWHQDNRIIFIHTSLIFLKIHFHCRMFHNFSI